MDVNTIEWDDSERTQCEIYKRTMGYFRPVSEFNIGKKQEHKERLDFQESIAMKTLVA